MNIENAVRDGFVERLALRGVSPDTLSVAIDRGAIKLAGDGAVSEFGKALASGGAGVARGITAAVYTGPAIVAGILGYLMSQSQRVSAPDVEAKRRIIVTRELEEQRRRLAEARTQP